MNHPPTELDKNTTLASLPAEWPQSLMQTIAERVASDNQTIVVLDDDPTGTQTVYDLPVLTQWTSDSIAEEFSRATPAFYIMTNSRSLTPERAAAINTEIAERLLAAARAHGRGLSIISRSDSTLRGHYPLEIDTLAAAIASESADRTGIDGQIIVPFFLEGGRYTIDDIHYVAEGDRLIPAAATPFASDPAFGFTQSNLRAYVEEKTAGRIKRTAVQSITIDDLRRGGPDAVRAKLSQLSGGQACIVNSASLRDMEVFAMGLLDAERDGLRVLARSAASFVQARLGLPTRPILNADVINQTASPSGEPPNREPGEASTRPGGLVIVGSYVPKTTKQLELLLGLAGIEIVELDVAALIERDRAEASLADALRRVEAAIASGRNAVVYTSRTLLTGDSPAASLAIGNTVSEGLVSIVANLGTAPRFIIAKGGITSSDVATVGLGIRRAMVLGQAAPGIPVWSIGEEGKFPGMSYVVFPGNVGDDDALTKLVERLSH